MTKRDLSFGPTDQREGVSLSMRKINRTHLKCGFYKLSYKQLTARWKTFSFIEAVIFFQLYI